MHDGFGVVIVTIQMAGPQSVIALLKGADSDFDITVEKEKERCWTFSLNVGDCYILSGDARNVCDHGVLCVGGGRRSHKVDAARESLEFEVWAAYAGVCRRRAYWQFPSFSSTLQAAARASHNGEAPAAKGRRRRRRWACGKLSLIYSCGARPWRFRWFLCPQLVASVDQRRMTDHVACHSKCVDA